MKIIYHDYGGSHSSVTAAAIHLGILPEDTVPTGKEIMEKVPHFDGMDTKYHGSLFFRGTDEMGNEVFTMGSAIARKVALNSIKTTTKLWGHKETELFFVYTMPCVNFIMMVGGFFSRALKIVSLGRPIVMAGTLMAYPSISRLVQQKKKELVLLAKKEKSGDKM